jgi:hypothetical protein
MEAKCVLSIVPMSTMPPGRKQVCARCMKILKSDESAQSRTVAQGLCQETGK